MTCEAYTLLGHAYYLGMAWGPPIVHLSTFYLWSIYHEGSSRDPYRRLRHLLGAGGKGGMVMDCKASVNSLKAPEQSSAAPHGPDLAIDDFLARAVA